MAPSPATDEIKIRCRQLCLLVNMKVALTEINHNSTTGCKTISAVAEKPWCITVMNGFINAFLNKENIF